MMTKTTVPEEWVGIAARAIADDSGHSTREIARAALAAVIPLAEERGGQRGLEEAADAAHNGLHDAVAEMTECSRLQSEVSGAISALRAAPAQQPRDIPLGAIENGREHFRRLEEHYVFECEGGPLGMCADFREAQRCFEWLACFVSESTPAQQPADVQAVFVKALRTAESFVAASHYQGAIECLSVIHAALKLAEKQR